MLPHLLMLFLGIIMIVYPELFFYLERWKYQEGASPSKLLIWCTRFGGVILLVVGIITI